MTKKLTKAKSARPESSVLAAVANQYIMLLKAVSRSLMAMSFSKELPGLIDGELVAESIQAANTLTG